MDERRVSFEHDGHHFELVEERRAMAGREPQFVWGVTMDGALALEFEGPYPYRDDDVRARVVEWYEIQQQRR